MKTRNGIKGIRKFLSEGAKHEGWQVFIDDEYVTYFPQNAFKIVEICERATAKTLRLSDVIGNGLWFASE